MTRTTFVRAAYVVALAVLAACGEDGTNPDLDLSASQVVIDAPWDWLYPGEVMEVEASVTNGEGDEVQADLDWSSSDASVISVTGSGVVTGIAEGVAWLRVQVEGTDGEVADSMEIVVVADEVALTSPDPTVALYETLVVVVPSGGLTEGDVYAGAIGADSVYFSASAADTLMAVVMDVPTGSGTLHVDLGTTTGTLAVTIEAAAVVANPEEELTDVGEQTDSILAVLEDLAVSTGTAIPGTDAVRVIAEEWATWMDTASAASKQQVAQILDANPEFADLWGAAASGTVPNLFAASMGPIPGTDCIGGESRGWRKLAHCTIAVSAAVALYAVGQKAASICAVPANQISCLFAAGAVIAGAVIYVRAGGELLGLHGLIYGNGLETFLQKTGYGEARLQYALAVPGGLSASSADLESGALYSVETIASLRTITSADAGRSGGLGTAVSALVSFDEFWRMIRGLVDRLPTFLRSRLPALPAGPGVAPSSPASIVTEAIETADLALGATTGDIEASFDPAAGELEVDLTSGIEDDYSVILVLTTPFETVTDTLQGEIRRAAEIEIVSGNGQGGTAGEALDSVLRVRVVDLHTGTPISGAPVTWTVATGGGSVSPASVTTGADGTATTTWTLGSAEGEQTVTAEVRYADGAAAATPVTFTASDNINGVYAWILFDGHPIPYTVEDSIRRETWTGGSLTLEGEDAWEMVLSETSEDLETGETYSGNETLAGTYVRSGDTLSLTVLYEDGEPSEEPDGQVWVIQATLDGARITTDPGTIEGWTLVFER